MFNLSNFLGSLQNEAARKQPALLPVAPDQYKQILVVGDNATRNLMLGGGSSELKVKKFISPLDGLKKYFGNRIVLAQSYYKKVKCGRIW